MNEPERVKMLWEGPDGTVKGEVVFQRPEKNGVVANFKRPYGERCSLALISVSLLPDSEVSLGFRIEETGEDKSGGFFAKCWSLTEIERRGHFRLEPGTPLTRVNGRGEKDDMGTAEEGDLLRFVDLSGREGE